MAVSFHGFGSNRAGGAVQATVTMSADSAGDRLIAVVSADNGNGSTITTPGTGTWVQLDYQNNLTPDGETVAIYECLNSPGTGSYAWTVSNDYSVVMQSFSGANIAAASAHSIVATSFSANASPMTVTASSVTTATINAMLVFAYGLDTTAAATSTLTTPPSGFTNGTAEAQVDNWGSCGLCSNVQAAIGASGSAAATISATSTAGWYAWLIAIPSTDVVAAVGPPINTNSNNLAFSFNF